jgi:hypothetical protein
VLSGPAQFPRTGESDKDRQNKPYWYKFVFQGQLIRESAKTNSKTVAREAERARRRDLELAINRVSRPERVPLFSSAASDWLKTKQSH